MRATIELRTLLLLSMGNIYGREHKSSPILREIFATSGIPTFGSREAHQNYIMKFKMDMDPGGLPDDLQQDVETGEIG